jgi:membrane-associated protease RseP (regulator of RpoE activity)
MNIDIDQITRYVERILSIEDITAGSEKQSYLVRYRGTLRMDSAEAYQSLDDLLAPYKLTPLFRDEDDRHMVLVMDGRAQAKPSNYWVNLVLFLVTLLSVIYTGALSATEVPPDASLIEALIAPLSNLKSGLPFAISLMAILLAHELGHYFVGRARHAPVTLPYFIPFPAPISPFGTMGAVIQMKAPPRDKRALLEIGIAGPLAGFIVAIPILLYGLSLSTVEPLRPIAGGAMQMEGNSLLYLLLKWIVFGQVLPSPADFGNLPPLLYWLRYFFTGSPFPWGGLDVMIHPIAFAGWAGLLVTALNLIPVGQLDGGHILYALLGDKARRLYPFMLGFTVLMGFAWQGWWLWSGLLLLFGRMYDQPLDQVTSLDRRRKVLAVCGLILFILVFTPVPLLIVTP